MQLKEEPPRCFGKENDPPGNGWDPRSPECNGGPDPAFTGPDGYHIRDKCVYFNSCGAKVQAKRMEQTRQLIAPQALTKPPTLQGPPQPTTQPSSFIDRLATAMYNAPVQTPPVQQVTVQKPTGVPAPVAPPTVQQIHPQQIHPQQIHPHIMQQMWQHQLQQMQPAMTPYGYQAMMPVNYQMPGYLTVPETKHPGQSFWSFLGATVARSMMKSAGHSIAHMFDTIPLGEGRGRGAD